MLLYRAPCVGQSQNGNAEAIQNIADLVAAWTTLENSFQTFQKESSWQNLSPFSILGLSISTNDLDLDSTSGLVEALKLGPLTRLELVAKTTPAEEELNRRVTKAEETFERMKRSGRYTTGKITEASIVLDQLRTLQTAVNNLSKHLAAGNLDAGYSGPTEEMTSTGKSAKSTLPAWAFPFSIGLSAGILMGLTAGWLFFGRVMPQRARTSYGSF